MFLWNWAILMSIQQFDSYGTHNIISYGEMLTIITSYVTKYASYVLLCVSVSCLLDFNRFSAIGAFLY